MDSAGHGNGGQGVVDQWIDELDAALRGAGDPARAVNEKAYLKSASDFYGVSVPVMRAMAKRFARLHRDITHDDLIGLIEGLWVGEPAAPPVHERRLLAVLLAEQHLSVLDAEDISVFEQMIRDAKTWALVDVIAASVVGALVVRHVELGTVLDRWASDDDFWIRRSALLALLGPLRAGGGDFERFGRYADTMLDEREFFIRKAIGWVLRDTARKRPQLVFEWIAPRARRASGVTMREVVKYLDDEQRRVISDRRT